MIIGNISSAIDWMCYPDLSDPLVVIINDILVSGVIAIFMFIIWCILWRLSYEKI